MTAKSKVSTAAHVECVETLRDVATWLRREARANVTPHVRRMLGRLAKQIDAGLARAPEAPASRERVIEAVLGLVVEEERACIE